MWYFERNYHMLDEMLQISQLLEQESVIFNLNTSLIELTLVEHTPYTLLLNVEHKFPNQQLALPDVKFVVRIYRDAQMAEVVSYQGNARLTIEKCYPNKQMRYRDDKRQTNLLLYDWLSSMTRLNYKESIKEHC